MDVRAALEEARRAPRPTLQVESGPVRRVALLSGSFDPPTVAHVALAEAAAGRAELVVLVYSVRTLAKERAVAPLLSEEERMRAIEAVCAPRERLAAGVCSHGLLVDQVRAAAARFPSAELDVVLGSDKARQLFDPRWYGDRDAELDALFGAARVAYAVRAGDEGSVEALLARPDNERWRDRAERVNLPRAVVAVSSGGVRMRARRGEDVRDVVPSEVLAIVRAAG